MPRFLTVLATIALLATPALGQAVEVRFTVNDALVKDHAVDGVDVSVRASADGEPIERGVTDASGTWVAQLAPGTYYVTYYKQGYVTIEATEAEIRQAGQVVTLSMLPSLESEAGEEELTGPRRVELILNWGSDSDQVKDADSHLFVPANSSHVYYFTKEQPAPGGEGLTLDVDDTDWGGPETVTIHGSAPGTYHYWVHDYTGSGGSAVIGRSDVVVRLIDGNAMLAEFRAEKTVAARVWRPFKALVVHPDYTLEVVDWTPEELAANAHLQIPTEAVEVLELETDTPLGIDELLGCFMGCLGFVFAIGVAAVLIRKAF